MSCRVVAVGRLVKFIRLLVRSATARFLLFVRVFVLCGRGSEGGESGLGAGRTVAFVGSKARKAEIHCPCILPSHFAPLRFSLTYPGCPECATVCHTSIHAPEPLPGMFAIRGLRRLLLRCFRRRKSSIRPPTCRAEDMTGMINLLDAK